MRLYKNILITNQIYFLKDSSFRKTHTNEDILVFNWLLTESECDIWSFYSVEPMHKSRFMCGYFKKCLVPSAFPIGGGNHRHQAMNSALGEKSPGPDEQLNITHLT